MRNVHEDHKGRKVVALGTQHRRLAVDFPGWGAPDYADYLLPIPAGLAGVITYVESHGSSPWTRYCVRFDDGTTSSGMVLADGGHQSCPPDIEFAPERPANTPGYNCRLAIWFTTTTKGKRRAWYIGGRSVRAFPLRLADAEVMKATGTAEVLCCHPWRPHTCGK